MSCRGEHAYSFYDVLIIQGLLQHCPYYSRTPQPIVLKDYTLYCTLLFKDFTAYYPRTYTIPLLVKDSDDIVLIIQGLHSPSSLLLIIQGLHAIIMGHALLFKDSSDIVLIIQGNGPALPRRGSEATTDLHADRAVVLGGFFPAGVAAPHGQCQAEPTLIAVEELLLTTDPARDTRLE